MAERFDVRYRGFVYIDQPGGGLPETSAVERAAKLLKSRKKTAQSMHPLFARGLDTKLQLEVTPSGVKVTVPSKDGPDPIVMNQPMHKIVLVIDIGTCTCFIVQRPGKGKYKCHSFETGSSKMARELAFESAHMCNKLFRKVRQSVRRLEKSKVLDVTLDSATKDLSVISALADQDSQVASRMQSAVTTSNEDDCDEEHMMVSAEVLPLDDRGDTDDVEHIPVDFIDGLSDRLAHLLGVTEVDDFIYDEFNLDNDVFFFGEIIGEASC
eukprot:m.215218 g.215218  ORF g.215218 m.215218 type:complete len:268 (-) comp16973_c2_seq2:314-1117(-)